MKTTSKTESDGRAKPPTSIVGPMMVSLVVHALLLVLLLTVALNVEPIDERSRTAQDAFVIALDDPIPITPDPTQTSTSMAIPTIDTPYTQDSLPSATDFVGSGTSPALPGIGRGGGGVASLVRGGGGTSGVSFAGLRTKRAQHIVYVVDGSGAMVTSLPFVVDELLRSVDRLGQSQHFAVVLFRNRPPTADGAGSKLDVFASTNGTMLLANQQNKQRLRAWTNQLVPRGMSNPSDGLARALSFKPDAVFVLARSIRRSGPNAGWGVGVAEIMAELDAANPRDPATNRRSTVIKTIQFIDEDPTGTMQQIGAEHGEIDGESGYSLLTLPELENLEHQTPTDNNLIQDPKIDRAVTILSTLSATGTDTAAIFGLGVAAERADAKRQATKALRAIRSSDATDNLTNVVRARASILLATAGDHEFLSDAIDQLTAASADLPPVAKLNLAIALLIRNNTGDHTRAAQTLADIDPAALDPTSLAEYLMARVMAEVPGSRDVLLSQMAGEPFRTPLGVDGSLCAAAADVLARAAIGSADPAVIAGALESWAELLREGSLAKDALLARAGAATANIQSEGMPLELVYAAGRAALRSEIERGDTIELLDQVAQAPSGQVQPWMQTAALRDAALARVAAWESNNESSLALHAARSLLQYVETTPAADDRQDMLTLSLGLCERLMLDETNPSLVAQVEAVYTAATALAIDILPREQGRSDRWVCAYARDLLQTETQTTDTAARTRAITLLNSITPDSPMAKDAATLRLYARLRTTHELRTAMLQARTQRNPSALADAATALLAECDLATPDATAIGGELADRLFADRADALVALADPAAEPIYKDLIKRNASVPGGSARLALGKAAATLAAGSAAQAFAEFRDLARQLDKPTIDGKPRPDEFWHAWTILVEISASNGRPVRAHVAGLIEIDPNLGGEPWRSRLIDANKP